MSFSERNIEHPELGKINFIKSTRAGRISISMKPFEPVRVTLPVYLSYQRAEDFLESKQSWILKNLEKIRRLEDNYTTFTEQTDFHTHEHTLSIVRYEGETPKVSLQSGKILVQLPDRVRAEDPEIQELIRWGVQAAWRKEAKRYLPNRLADLSRKHQLPFNKVTIKNNKTRWGSCSQKNNINLSLHLMRLPEHLIDYILLHELAHTVQRNHGRGFWKQLEKICPDARILDKELKGYRIDIY